MSGFRILGLVLLRCRTQSLRLSGAQAEKGSDVIVPLK